MSSTTLQIFDLVQVQGHPWSAKVPISSLLMLEVWNVKPTYRKSWAENLLMWSDLTLDPPLQGQTRIAKLKRAYNSLTIGPSGLECEINVYGN